MPNLLQWRSRLVLCIGDAMVELATIGEVSVKHTSRLASVTVATQEDACLWRHHADLRSKRSNSSGPLVRPEQ